MKIKWNKNVDNIFNNVSGFFFSVKIISQFKTLWTQCKYIYKTFFFFFFHLIFWLNIAVNSMSVLIFFSVSEGSMKHSSR